MFRVLPMIVTAVAAASPGFPAPAPATATANATGRSDPSYAIEARYPLGGPGGWDYLTADPQRQRLFITRGDRIIVMSTVDGSVVGTLDHTEGVHGVALAPELGRGFTSNGRANSVTVFDLATLAPLATLPLRAVNPDTILYDPDTRHVFTFNGGSHDITVIDPATSTVLADLPAGGKPEFAASDAAGRVYYNVEDTGRLGVLDARTLTTVAAWSLPGCDSPAGLAIDAVHRRVFSTCSNGVMAVTDADSGRQVGLIPIGKGPDAAAFDTGTGLVFSSNGRDGTLTIVHEDDPEHYSVVATLATRKSARTMALDPLTHRVYVVAAEFGDPPPPTAAQPRPRPPVRDGSFEVIVIGTRGRPLPDRR